MPGKTGSAFPTVLPPWDELFLIVVSILLCSVGAEVASAWVDEYLKQMERRPPVKEE